MPKSYSDTARTLRYHAVEAGTQTAPTPHPFERTASTSQGLRGRTLLPRDPVHGDCATARKQPATRFQ